MVCDKGATKSSSACSEHVRLVVLHPPDTDELKATFVCSLIHSRKICVFGLAIFFIADIFS